MNICWCCARYGLTVIATHKSHGVGERASEHDDICGPCAGRGSTACHNAHTRTVSKAN